jgi:hypothetical protein
VVGRRWSVVGRRWSVVGGRSSVVRLNPHLFNLSANKASLKWGLL